MRKFIAFFIAINFIILSCFMNVSANNSGEANELTIKDTQNDGSYSDYIGNCDDTIGAKQVQLKGSEYLSADRTIVLQDEYKDNGGKTYENVAVIDGNTEITYKVFLQSAGLYCIELQYLPTSTTGNDIGFSTLIDGKIPFSEAAALVLPRYWKDNGDIRKDDFGNEVAPTQTELKEFTKKMIYDPSGVVIAPYKFFLTAGEHTITLKLKNEPMALATLELVPPEQPISYSELKKQYDASGYEKASGEAVRIEAEKATAKSTRSLIPKSDSSTPNISPSNAVRQTINYIGNTNWQKPNEEIKWSVKVEKAGLYKLGFMYNQNQIVNGYSYRWLKIDGETPFAEASSVKYKYHTSWNFCEFADDNNEAYLFYLDEGEHELSLAVTLGETAQFYNSLQAVCFELQKLYLDIIMITGESPDPNRDYDLYVQIPGFGDILQKNYDKLQTISADLQKTVQSKTNSQISVLKNMSRVLENMIKNIYKAEDYLGDYYSNYSSISSSLTNMTIMPLCLDQILLIPSGSDFQVSENGFWQNLQFSLTRFLISFSSDYDNISSEVSDLTEIKLWVNWGRDQAMVLNSLIQSSFTPQNNIKVNLQITNASMINGMLAKNAPDIALNLSRTEPVNLAMRDALYNLREFDDFDKVVTRFQDTATIPYEYKNGVYALPDTQTFYIMYYRKDILEKLKIKIPETWDEFLAAASVLQINNMEAWMSYTPITSATTVNTGVGGLNLFASILQQNGASFYNDSLTECTLGSPAALSAFSFWSDIYTKYKFPTAVSFYNRFRIGITPLGIDTYNIYTQIKDCAPEIEGRWGIAPVPGTPQKDGTVDHTVAGAGSGCVILNTSKEKEASWEFLTWRTSAETQLLYNNEVESILGKISRITTSNTEAFQKMSWDPIDLEILLAQREQIREIPEVPGSYYVSRAVDQTFWNVFNNGANVKDALLKWTEIANSEITRKINEYN
ncbi:MAG: extracellular solute-binding protein [Oscillospiraceae bacterium]